MMGMMMGAQMAGGVSNALHQKEQPASQAPPQIPGKNKYFVAVDGAQTGPFTTSELKEKIASKGFTADSLVWMEGMTAWEKASTREDLKDLFGAAPPPIPKA